MAGEIEEPFRLNFQVDSFRSGSISFGRYESEALCWERWSSFSHNRYLEEVEKCSKPGSVTEKKAYFEAHFRKKGFPGQSSSDCLNETEYQTSENCISWKTGYDEEIDRMNPETHSVVFESLYGSVDGEEQEVMECETEVIGTSFSEPQFGLVSESTKEADGAELGNSLSINSQSGTEVRERFDCKTTNLDTSHVSNMAIVPLPHNNANEENTDVSPKDKQILSPKEKTPLEVNVKPNLMPRVSVGRSRRYTSRNASKSLENKASKTVPLRSKPEKKTSEDPNKCSMHQTPKYETRGSPHGINVIPQSCASQKVSSRVHQSANRVNPAVGQTEPRTRWNNSRCSFKCDERAQRRKEFDKKLEEKMNAKEAEMLQVLAKNQEKTKAEIKQLRKSISFKAIPMPSFYREAVREPDGNKAKASNIKPQNPSSKSSNPAIRTSRSSPLSSKAGLEQVATKATDPPRASGPTSSHSTVTSDSSASSPAGTSNGTSNGHHYQARMRAPVNQKKDQEKEKLTSLVHSKAPKGNREQKPRTGRTTYTSFNSSQRTGRMAVGVAS